MYKYEIHFRGKILCSSEEYPIKGWASALARNIIWRLCQEWNRVGYQYEVKELVPVLYEVSENGIKRL